MEYTNVTWSEVDTVDYKRLDQMAYNDEAAKMLALKNPKGILGFAEWTGTHLNFTNSLMSIGNTSNGSGTWTGIPMTVTIEKNRHIAANFFAPYCTTKTPAIIDQTDFVAHPIPHPRFYLYVQSGTVITELATTYEITDFNWDVTPNGGISDRLTGSVSFTHIIPTLASGTWTFDIQAKSQSSTAEFYIESGSADPIQFWIEDLGAESYV
jgi:hypothetical protein